MPIVNYRRVYSTEGLCSNTECRHHVDLHEVADDGDGYVDYMACTVSDCTCQVYNYGRF